MNITIQQVQGLTFVGKGESNHWVPIDGPKRFNGSESATTAMELVLIALGGCTASDVTSILQKKRATLNHLEVNVTADRAETHPKVYTTIHVEYVFDGTNLIPKDLEQAIELSLNNYCSVSAMLGKSCTITHSYRVENAI